MKACRRWRRRATRALAAVLVLAAPALAAPASDSVWYPSDGGGYRLAFTSDLEGPAINRMHGWVLHLRRTDGAAVEGAELTVSGGMPAHDHGLPTRPQITRELGGGDYRLDGVRFHMHGAWEVVVRVLDQGRSDRIVIDLDL